MLGLSRKRNRTEGVGIHIGTRSLTLVRAVRPPGTPRILQLFSEPLPRQPGEWPVRAVAEKLARARTAVNLSAEIAGMTVSSDLAATDFLDLPKLDGEQLAEAVRLQLGSRHGAGAQVSHEFVVLERYRERCRVFAASIPTPTLKVMLDSFLAVRCKVDAVGVDSVSLAALLSRLGLAGVAPVAVLNVGPQWSEIHILKKGKIAFSRPILKPEVEEAGPAEKRHEPSPARGEEPAGLSASHLTWVAREANKTLDYFEIELLSQAVDRMFLIGEGTQDPALADALRGELQLEVGVLAVDGKVEDETGRFVPALHALALAAALHEEGGSEN